MLRHFITTFFLHTRSLSEVKSPLVTSLKTSGLHHLVMQVAPVYQKDLALKTSLQWLFSYLLSWDWTFSWEALHSAASILNNSSKIQLHNWCLTIPKLSGISPFLTSLQWFPVPVHTRFYTLTIAYKDRPTLTHQKPRIKPWCASIPFYSLARLRFDPPCSQVVE